MNILVCGSAPCFISDTRDKDLSEFDKIVRINTWDNAIVSNVWCGQVTLFKEPAREAKEIWCVNYNSDEIFYKNNGRKVDYTISKKDTEKLHIDMGQKGPTSGAVTIWMALGLGADVSVCGFDFYGSDKMYYNSDIKTYYVPHHDLKNEKEWFMKKIDLGYFTYLQ